jgi:hypothetical protein
VAVHGVDARQKHRSTPSSVALRGSNLRLRHQLQRLSSPSNEVDRDAMRQLLVLHLSSPSSEVDRDAMPQPPVLRLSSLSSVVDHVAMPLGLRLQQPLVLEQQEQLPQGPR